RQWIANPLTGKNIELFKQRCSEFGYSREHILPHDSYLINLGSPEADKLQKSRQSFIEELKRVEQLDLLYLNFHPGSHLRKISEDECIKLIAESLNLAIQQTSYAIPVIENTAGQGSNIGYRFEHLAQIIELVDVKNRIAVCLDTCHTFTAGYDLRTKDSFEKTMSEFNNVVGLKYLKGMHLNDSKPVLGKKVDRHSSLGEGNLGWEAFRMIATDKRFDDIPLILETPNPDIWAEEIRKLKELENSADRTSS
ncbi:MAG: deoxyribonuclease IV, partial [Candidatus Cloacimonetes bacterium]|nr:deoxyribonuclease IV [Candidatus Cloacimonadota bacterium]